MTHAGSKNKSEMRRRRCYVILGVSVLVACLVFYFLPRPPKDQPIDKLPQNPGNMLRETTSEAATAQPSTVSLRVTSSASADPTVAVTPTVPSSPAEATSPPSLPSFSAKTSVEATSEKTIPSDVTESQNVVGTLPGAGDSSANSSGTTSLGSTSSRRYTPDWKSLDTRPSPSWFDEAKVGIFLHWGVFSVPSFKSEWFWSEWNNKDPEVVEFMRQNYKPNFTYPEFAPQFTAQFFDPDRWADLFYKSGARYVVLTSKHHEGYTLWPSSVSWNWNAGDVGPKRDLVGDLATAIRKKGGGVHFGLYHSLYEWFNPLYLADKAARWTTNDFVVRKTMPELREIVERYKPDVIWSDGDWEANDTYWNSTEFLAWLYNDSPVKSSVVVNDRWGIGIPCHHGDFYNCHDRYNPGILLKHKWENAMTIDKRSWGYRRNANLSDYLSIEKLIEELASTVSCNGNILINVGPTKDGVIEPVFEERLLQLGRWLGVNGEAVYGSKPWKHQNDTLTPGIWYTTNKDMDVVYVFVLKWPRFNKLTLESLVLSQRARITMLGLNDDLFQWGRTGGSDDSSRRTVTILFPPLTPDLLPTPWAWVLKVEGAL